MALPYTVVESDKAVLTWTNPHGGTSQATVVDQAITELIVQSATGGNIVYSTDQTDLTHLNTVLGDLLNYLID